jgi:hypothetical protein
MLLDKNLMFAEGVDTGNTGTRLVGDVVDLSQRRDIGAGEPIFMNVLVTTGITAASAGTYQVALSTADNDALTTNVENVLLSAAVVTGATAIPAGTELLNVAIPSSFLRRYIGVREIVGTQNTTAGAITAFISKDQAAYRAYAGEK